jgi:hypothetical protein
LKQLQRNESANLQQLKNNRRNVNTVRNFAR